MNTATQSLFDSSAYFKSRADGFVVRNSFAKNILRIHEKLMPYRGLDGVKGFSPKVPQIQGYTDREIIDDILGGEEEAYKHLFTSDQIAQIIDLKQDKREHELSKDSGGNLFLMSGEGGKFFFARVYWDVYVPNWDIGSSELRLLSNYRWHPSVKIFRNTVISV